MLLLIIISTFPLFSIWRTGVFESGDFAFHTKLLISFDHALQTGVIIPQWSAEFCGGFGYPHFKYFYVLPYYLGTVFHSLGLSYINSMKLLLSLSFFVATISMFVWLKNEFSRQAAFLGSLMYSFAPYLLADLHFKHAYGELLSFVFLPLIFLSVKKFVMSRQIKWWLGMIFCYSCLILSHHITPLLTLPLIASYIFYLFLTLKHQKLKILTQLLLAIIFSFLLTLWHWLPIISEANLIKQSQLSQIEFNQWWEYFVSPWKLGFLFQGKYGQVSPLIGYTQVAVALIGLWLCWKKSLIQSQRWLLIGLLLIWLLALMMMQRFTHPLWQALPFFKYFQFSSRLMYVLVFIQAIIAAVVAEQIRKSWLIILLALITVGYTFLNWGNRGMIADINDAITINQMPDRCDAIALPRNIDEKKLSELILSRDQNSEIVAGQGKVEELSHQSELHSYQIAASTAVTFKDNTLYFPGWAATDNNQPVEVSYDNDQYPGVMVVKLSPGDHQLVFKYVGTQIYQLSVLASAISLAVLILFTGGWFWRTQNEK
jgi:hypothetical protein